jgi:hypothetical protein
MSQLFAHTIATADISKIKAIVDSFEDRDSTLLFRIRATVDSQEYILYRDYAQFKAFRSSLKLQFPKLELPSFPSKFSFINKKESQRKSFDKFLQYILLIGPRFPEVPKKDLLRHLTNFLGEGRSSNISENLQTKDPIVEAEQIKFNDGILTSEVEIKLDDEDWIRYYASLIGGNIYLFPDEFSLFSMMICCSGVEITESDTEENVLELHHPYEKRPILLRAQNWQKWRDELVISGSGVASSTDYKLKSIGKLFVKIYTGQSIKFCKPAASLTRPHVFVRLTLDDLIFETSILPQEHLLNWNQTFVL